MALEVRGVDMGNWDVMNPPIPNDGQAYSEKDFKTGRIYICCPHCGNRNFYVGEETVIQALPWRCKGSKCKKDFEVNYG